MWRSLPGFYGIPTDIPATHNLWAIKPNPSNPSTPGMCMCMYIYACMCVCGKDGGIN